MGRINTGRLGLKSDKHRGPTALGVYFFKPRPTGVYSTHLKPPRNDLFLKSLCHVTSRNVTSRHDLLFQIILKLIIVLINQNEKRQVKIILDLKSSL